MKRQLLFVQGGGARVHDEWDAKLVESLRRELGPGYEVRYPRMLNALAEDPPERELGAIFLIAAPFVGEGGWQSDDLKPQRELGEKLPSEVPIYLYHGLADDTAPPSHAELYARAIPRARLYYLPGRDHQLNNDLREIAAVIRAMAAS